MATQKSNIPALRFPEFKGEWKEKRIEQIIKGYRLGGNYSNTEEENEFPLIKMGNLGRGNINLNKLEYIQETELVSSLYKIKYGDLFFNTRNTLELVGKVAIWRNELPCAYYNSNLMLIDFENNFYMNYRFNSYKGIKNLRNIASGTTSVAAIYTKDFLKVKLFVSDEPEQKKIADFLTAVDQKIAQLSEKKSCLEQYKKGVMQLLFTQRLRFHNTNGNPFADWEEGKLGDIANITTGDSNREDSNLSGEYTFFDRSQDIRSSDRYLFDGEAIIVAGEGQEFCPKYFIGKFDLHQRTYAIMNFPKAHGKYLFYYVDFYKNYFLSVAVGSTVKSLRLPMFYGMPIKIPNIKEQQKIADFLTAIDTKITALGNQLTTAQDFKKSLLQKMFV